jgi:hypothetical protein
MIYDIREPIGLAHEEGHEKESIERSYGHFY